MPQKKLYILTDGAEIYKARAMTRDEWVDARHHAANMTDGNLNWDLVSDIPVADCFGGCK